jgi:hypothetical protein
MPPLPAAVLWLGVYCELTSKGLCAVLTPEWLDSDRCADDVVEQAHAAFERALRDDGSTPAGPESSP